jgi:outer membrane protein assembly factor BamB
MRGESPDAATDFRAGNLWLSEGFVKRAQFVITYCAAAFLLSPAVAGDAVGWRSDGTGRYPSANPPTKWAGDKNLVWKTKLPGRSHCGPVVVGKRIFVSSEPDVLVCLNAKDGTILWQKQVTNTDVFGPDKAARIADDARKARELERELRTVRRELRQLKKDGAGAEKTGPLEKKQQTLRDRIAELTKFAGSRRGANGNATATPVSDGDVVVVVFGNGIVAAYSVGGKGRWFKYVEAPRIGFGHSTSPVIADGKVIVHYNDLVALDLKDGREVWRAKAAARHGSPVVAKIGGAAVVVTAGGAAVKAADGTVLADRLFRLGHCSPVIHNDAVYAMGNGRIVAVALPKAAETGAEWKVRWEGAGMRQRRFASPVLHDGLIYGVTESGILDVMDEKTGKLVYRKRLDFGRRGRVYPSPAIAGRFVFLGSDNGTTLVLKTGRRYEEVARNELEPFSGAPVFIGSRMYVRGRTHMYCIGK